MSETGAARYDFDVRPSQTFAGRWLFTVWPIRDNVNRLACTSGYADTSEDAETRARDYIRRVS